MTTHKLTRGAVSAHLQRRATQVPPETLLGKAVNYTLTQWPKLVRYLEHPAVPPDTNVCENAIRPFVLRSDRFAPLRPRLRLAAALDPRESAVVPERLESVTMPAAVLSSQYEVTAPIVVS